MRTFVKIILFYGQFFLRRTNGFLLLTLNLLLTLELVNLLPEKFDFIQ